jgi:transcriptional regulator with XRE-family HTH domain
MVHIMKHSDNYYFDIIRYNIKKYREEKHLTQQQLADRAGLTMNYLSKIESVKMQRGFSIVTLTRVADALGINIKDLFDEEIEKD